MARTDFLHHTVLGYPVLVEPGTATAAFGVVVPGLPGCFSPGDTLEEALANTVEAIGAWIEVAAEDGEPIPAPTPPHR